MDMISMIDNDSDVFNLILNNLTSYDIINLSQVNSYINYKLEEHVYNLDHKCMSEIEDAWNDLAICITNLFLTSKYDINTESHGCMHYHGYDGIDIYNTDIKCSVCPNKYHALKVTYSRNSRDVRLLAWYNKDIEMGYRIF